MELIEQIDNNVCINNWRRNKATQEHKWLTTLLFGWLKFSASFNKYVQNTTKNHYNSILINSR